jgi:hypothetical protein
MSENSGLAVYMMYNALRLHFTTDSYDYFKYNGKTNTTKESFLTHKNKYAFYRLSRKHTLEDARDFFVANFLESDTKWVGELLTEEAEEVYTDWKKRNQSLFYQFESDTQYLLDNYDAHDIIKPVDGSFPVLLMQIMRKKVTLETLVIMNNLMNFLPMWEKKIDDDIVWPMWQRKIKKYAPFVVYDKMKYKNKLKELYENSQHA